MTDPLHERWPDAWFAARFLPRPRRAALSTVFAVIRQLDEVLCGTTCDSQSCTCEPIGERQRVAMAILDHLWRGEPTGKPELDAFAAVARGHDLQRAWFERAIEAMSATLPPRVATWKRLREHLEAWVSPRMSIVARVLDAGESTPQMMALGTAMRMTRLLEHVRDDAAAGRVVLPLDDLVKCNITDTQVPCMRGADDRWRAVVNLQNERVTTLFDGGAKALGLIGDARTRRAVAVFIELERRRQARCVAAMLSGTTPRGSASLGERLSALPRAMRAAMKGRSP